MFVQNLAGQLQASFQNLLDILISFLPLLIGALIVIIIGLIVSLILKKAIVKVFGALKVDQGLRKLAVEKYVEGAGLKLDSGAFVGTIVYWFFVLVFILAAADILKFTALSQFINRVINYVPNILVASLILAVTFVVAKLLKELVEKVIIGARLHGAKTVGLVTWWIVVVFGILSVFVQLGIAAVVINTLITGLIAMLALAGGLAFGIGGKDQAAKVLEKVLHRPE